MKKRSNTSLVLCVLLILLAAILISCNSGDQAPLPTDTQPKPTETEAPKVTDPIGEAPEHTDNGTNTDDKTDNSHTHTWGAWNITKSASCTENGVKTDDEHSRGISRSGALGRHFLDKTAVANRHSADCAAN